MDSNSQPTCGVQKKTKSQQVRTSSSQDFNRINKNKCFNIFFVLTESDLSPKDSLLSPGSSCTEANVPNLTIFHLNELTAKSRYYGLT